MIEEFTRKEKTTSNDFDSLTPEMGLGWTQIVFRYYESSDMLLLPAVLYIVEYFSARPLYPTHIV